MFYVCVVCMVNVKENKGIKLTGARCQLWELMISPRINIEKLRKCLLLVCPECNQLLSTMLEFQRTMHIGAKNLLFLYKNLRIKNQVSPLVPQPEPCHDLPVVIAQSDDWLPVANEEVVQSDEWLPVANEEVVQSDECLPLANEEVVQSDECLPLANEEVVQSETWTYVDYAVLIPINKDTNLQCKEDFVDSSELSETSKIEKAKPIPTFAKKKIKMNRQLFEAIRVTLKSPSLIEEFNFKYEPEPESESGCKSGPELAREWELDLALESALESERKLVLESECKSGLESQRESVLKSVLEWASELAPESALESERKSGLESERKSGLESARKLERKSGLESERKSRLESERKSGIESERKSGLESERKSGLESERKSGLESECKSGIESERKSGHELERKSGHELDPDSESTRSCQSDYEDPEHFPNIIFAKAFNWLADKEEQLQETVLEQGDESAEHIHCHLVTNPPSEWPCTDEHCHEDSRIPSDSPPGTPIVRNKKNVEPGRPRCKLCGRSFVKISMLWHHFERSHMDAKLKCSVCRKEFRNETELTFHKMKHQFKKTVEFQFEAPSRHTCLECAVRCRTPGHLRMHLSTRTHLAKMLWRFQCDICKRKCLDKTQMAEHIQREHLAKEAVKCSMCSATFGSVRTLRAHVAKHILDSHTQTNKQTDKQTNAQAHKRARDTHAKGNEHTDSGILRNGEETQTDIHTNGPTRKRPHDVTKTSTAGHRPPPKSATNDTLPGHQSTLATKRPRKTTYNELYAYTNRRRNTHADTNINEQHDMEIQTNGQTSKKPRKVTHEKVNSYTNSQGNRVADTNINEQGETEMKTDGQTTKKPRKVTHKKLNAYANRQTNEYTYRYINEQDDMTEIQSNGQTSKKQSTYTNNQGNKLAHTYINAQDGLETNKQTRKITNTYTNRQGSTHAETHINKQGDMEIQSNGQTRKKPGKAKNSQANTFTNKQENIRTDKYVQESKHTETQKNTHKIIPTHGRNTHTAIQANDQEPTDSHTNARADTQDTHTNGRVRKRRKRRSYVTSKRARMLAKAAAERARAREAVAKTSLFDMLSSFIL